MSTIVLRSVKGTPLTNTEVDANFNNLNTDKIQLGGTYSSGSANGVLFLSSSKVLTTGSALTFDGSNFVVNPTNTQFYVGSSFAKIENKAGASASFVMADTSDSATIKNVGSSIAFVNSGTEGMRLTSTGLGIGTSSPGSYGNDSKLVVQTSSATNGIVATFSNSGSTGAAIQLFQGGVDTAMIGMPAGTGGLTFAPSGTTERMRLDSSGNLGLGVTPSAWAAGIAALEMKDGSVLAAAGTSINYACNAYYDTAWRYKVSGAASYFRQLNGAYQFFTAPSGTAGNAISFSQAMTLDASGNLGIGTSSPVGKLHVNSTGTYTTPATANQIVIGESSGNNNYRLQLGYMLSNSTTWQGSIQSYVAGVAGDLIINGEGGYVGVGTTSAYWKLSVSDGTVNGGIQPTSGNLYFGTKSNSPIIFRTNDSDKATLDSSGNLGLGVTPSAWGGAGNIDGINGFTWSSYDGSIGNGYYYNGGYKYKSTTAPSLYMPYGGVHKWFTAPSGTAGNAISFTQAMTLDSSGNLLCGVTSATNDPTQGITLMQNGNIGNIGIGHATGTASGNSFVKFSYNGTTIGNIAQSGTTAVSYNTSSDYRLKENIQPMTGALAKVAALKPVTYTWKADGSAGEGFIAHELAEVCPAAVTGEKDAVDAEGNPQYQGIDVSFLVGTLTAAIQELNAKFEAYKASHP